MSLGLNDLNKRKRPTKETQKASSPESAVKETSKYPAGAWTKSSTARPWSGAGLARSASRKRVVDTDATMNDEWLNLHAAPIFWVDFAQNSQLMRAQERLAEIEEAIQSKVCSTFAALRGFFSV